MGDFVSRGGSRNRVEISDDEDDEIEEINTVSIKMDKKYQVAGFFRRSDISEEFRESSSWLKLKVTLASIIFALLCKFKSDFKRVLSVN